MSLATNEKFIKFYGLEFWKTFILIVQSYDSYMQYAMYIHES